MVGNNLFYCFWAVFNRIYKISCLIIYRLWMGNYQRIIIRVKKERIMYNNYDS